MGGRHTYSHLLERTKVPIAGAEEQELRADIPMSPRQDGGTYAEDKANWSLHWKWNNLMLGYQGEYISALDADTFGFAAAIHSAN